MLAKTLLYSSGSRSISDDKIFVDMQEGFALIYRLCLRNKYIFVEDFFALVLIVLQTTSPFHCFVVILLWNTREYTFKRKMKR